jgi:hypothetical protein
MTTPTYAPKDAITVCNGYIRQMSIPQEQTVMLLDQTYSAFWTAKPDWYWSMATLTAIALVNGQQDYTVTNTDVLRYSGSYRITQTDSTPDRSIPLDVVEHLEPDLTSASADSIRAICYVPSISKLRLDKAVSVTGTNAYQIDGSYQKIPTKIKFGNLATAFAFPDHYFECFCEGYLYKLYKYTNDQRAGTLQVSKSGDRQYTGQLGLFMAKMQEVMESEDFGNGQAYRFPAEPLVVGRGWWPGSSL